MLIQSKKTAIRWGPLILLMATIFIASSTPFANLPSFGGKNSAGRYEAQMGDYHLLDTLIQKAGHLGGYFLLTLAFLRGFNRNQKKTVTIVLGLVLLFAASDEFHQSFVLGRHPTLVDVVIDLTGAGLATWAVRVHAPLRRLIRIGL